MEKECWKCHKVKEMHPGQPLCHSCYLHERMIPAGHKHYVAQRRWNPRADPRDKELLGGIAARWNTTPEFVYYQAWLKHKGKCGKCRRKREKLRCIATRYRVTSLRCNSCFCLLKQQRRAAVKEFNMNQYLWARADTVTKFMLSQNPRFMRDLQSKSLDMAKPCVLDSRCEGEKDGCSS